MLPTRLNISPQELETLKRGIRAPGAKPSTRAYLKILVELAKPGVSARQVPASFGTPNTVLRAVRAYRRLGASGVVEFVPEHSRRRLPKEQIELLYRLAAENPAWSIARLALAAKVSKGTAVAKFKLKGR